jgi:hypothetical protein
MALSTTAQTIAADYRYFVCDLVTNEVLTEIPFYNVSYGRAIREAGQFTGDIPVTQDNYNLNLYTNTIPGKTALYVVRNNVCVWGGIIWSRDYDIKNRILSVNANEFTSYLYHRVAWKTWSNEFEATVDVSAGTGTATLLTENFSGFESGYPVYIDFGSDMDDKYDGYYYILSSPAPTTNSFSFREKNGAFMSMSDSDGKEGAATVKVRQDTYEFARDFLKSLNLDFYDLRYDNTEIEPSAEFAQTMSSVARSSNIATITFPESHDLIVGQRVTVKNSKQPGYDGRQVVLTVPSSTTITFANTGANQSTVTLAEVEKTITKFARASFVATLTTSTDHGFAVGDIVTIYEVNGSIDGTHTVLGVPTSTTFTYTSVFSSSISESDSNFGYVIRSPEVRFSTYGEFSKNSGLDIDYSTQELSTQAPRTNSPFRGSDLSYVGELLEEYSNVLGGFEYRIDCTYDVATDSFKRQFIFMPLEPNSLTEYIASIEGGKLPAGAWAPISAFGADTIVFEHPGNILNATMQESAEDAATRFWVQGDDDTGTEGAALPHAADSAVDLLRDGWPILDQVEKIDGSSDEDTLFNYAGRYLNESLPPLSTFSIVADGSIRPVIGSYKPGDWCSVIIEDPFVQLRLQSGLEPGADDPARDGILLRKIDSFEVRVPDGPTFPEEVTLNLVTEPEVDKPGVPLLQLALLSKTTSSITMEVVVDLSLSEATSIILLRGSTTIKTWTIPLGGDLIRESYTATGLSAGTEYVFYLNGPGGYLDSLTITTEAS